MRATVGVLAAVMAVGVACAPPAQADGKTTNLDQIIGDLYTQVQRRCTPEIPPSFQGIQWAPADPTGGGGTGRIVDATPGLGGPFQVWWNLGPNPPVGYRSVSADGLGYWDIEFEFC